VPVDAPTPQGRLIPLPEADPDLVRGIPAGELRDLGAAVGVRSVRITPGPWNLSDADGHVGLLVLSGVLTRELLLETRASAQLYGPGDVIEPWVDLDSMVPVRTRWTATEHARVGILDVRFIAAQRRWPLLGVRLQARLAEQAHRLAVQQAIAVVGRVELRLLGMLWLLADRWGKVSPAGIVLPLRLTHEALGRLVGAQRPTVTLALGALEREGMLARRSDGGWILQHGSQERLAVPEAPPVLEPAAAASLEPLESPGVRSRRLPAPEKIAVPADAAPAVPELPVGEMEALIAELRNAMGHRYERVAELTQRARETSERSAELRERIARDREARALSLLERTAPSAQSHR
jgi:hypothetical protein